MADSVTTSCASSHILPEFSGYSNELTCNKCSAYEDQLKEALAELGSAQMIIDILQKELLSSASIANTQINNTAPMEGFVDTLHISGTKLSFTAVSVADRLPSVSYLQVFLTSFTQLSAFLRDP